MPQVIRLACAPALVVDDVGAGVDGLTVGSDEVGRWPGVVGGQCRVRGSVLELQFFGCGKLRVFSANGRPLEAALLPEEREYTRPCESAPAFCCSTAFASRALTYWICRASSPVAMMLSAAARPATRLSIGVENSGRPFASLSHEETTIRGWSLGGVRLGGGGAPIAVDPGGGRALPPGGAFSQIARSAMRAGSFSSSKFRARP